MARTIRVSVSDTLAFWDDELGTHVFKTDNARSHSQEIELADEHFDGAVPTEDGLERVYEAIYGKGWRRGNGDGSRYQVLSTTVEILRGDRAGAVSTRKGPSRTWTTT